MGRRTSCPAFGDAVSARIKDLPQGLDQARARDAIFIGVDPESSWLIARKNPKPRSSEDVWIIESSSSFVPHPKPPPRRAKARGPDVGPGGVGRDHGIEAPGKSQQSDRITDGGTAAMPSLGDLPSDGGAALPGGAGEDGGRKMRSRTLKGFSSRDFITTLVLIFYYYYSTSCCC